MFLVNNIYSKNVTKKMYGIGRGANKIPGGL